MWRPPRQLNVLGQIIEVRQVTATELKDLASDHDDDRCAGAWRADTKTIYLDKALSSVKKNRAYWHEIMHCLVDMFDRE